MSVKNSKKETAIRLPVEEIIDRMLEYLNLTNIADLAEIFGISPQAISNCRQRGTIPLTYLMRFQQKTGRSLDWIVSGADDATVAVKSMDGSGEPIRFDRKWVLNYSKSVCPTKIEYIQDGEQAGSDILLIDTTDSTLKDGIYVFKLNGQPIVKTVKVCLDGEIEIDGSKIVHTVISKLTCLGRAIWRGSSSVLSKTSS